MNERIKELWKQATEYAFSVTTLNETPKEWEELKLAKFAELIVRNVCNVAQHYADVDEGVAVAKMHFGVK